MCWSGLRPATADGGGRLASSGDGDPRPTASWTRATPQAPTELSSASTAHLDRRNTANSTSPDTDMATALPRLGVLPRRALLANASPRALCAAQPRIPLAGLAPAPQRPASLRFHTSAPRCRDGQHFDTLRFVHRLKEEGLTEEQAAALMRILNDTMEER
ncbi:hypothetical protein IMZ48_16825 [Candidatus Bathyarchaeota archaeon]|nr:hypothetical protein [Candidatus Bathyarchaeota archaeon]